jgi:hypothetical protein
MAETPNFFETGVLVAVGGAIGHSLSWVLRFLKARSDKDERITDETFEYAEMIRKDMEKLKCEMFLIREENTVMRTKVAELSARMESLYERNVELTRRAKAYDEHIEKCREFQDSVRAIA